MINAVQVAVELGRDLKAAEQAQITQWITDSYAIIHARYPQGGFDPAVADRAVRTTVARYVLLPKSGETAHEVGIDDARTVRRYSATSAAVTLDGLLAAWWPLLDAEPAPGQAFSITPAWSPP